MIEVSVIKPEDHTELLVLAKQMHEESQYARLPFKEERVRSLGRNLDEPFWCGLKASDRGNPIGFLVGYVQPYFFSDELVAQDLAFFVSPDKRGAVAAKRMVQAFEEWAKIRGAIEVYLSSSTMYKTEKVRKFYESLGYDTIGFVARKELV